MASTECYVRRLLAAAKDDTNYHALDEAFNIINGNVDRAGWEFPPDVLLQLGEVSNALETRPNYELRALELLERLKLEDNQLRARALLLRCLYESKVTNQLNLKGDRRVDRIKFALGFLLEAIKLALQADKKERYGFLVYNASLVFWEVSRPLMRPGWRQHLVEPVQQVIAAVNQLPPKPIPEPIVANSSAARAELERQRKEAEDKAEAPPGKGVPCPVDVVWKIELLLQLAFCLEDAGKVPDGQKALDEAVTALKNNPNAGKTFPWLPQTVLSARCHFAKLNSGSMNAVRTDANASNATRATATVSGRVNDGVCPTAFIPVFEEPHRNLACLPCFDCPTSAALDNSIFSVLS
uniref:Uncharacterized protein n=1 Tax=Chromera velia CCMP2878 TaxID=1169474 RepID=A0A0G4HKB8_9ALVE|eukprot:Cvel_28574.t1-p1 / transcript=Cvel_28574.t1 / gene=Cvel_28574 / organism=Chromera_velia_CCMP2878 / gene_product=Tetratricopeptide repeat protein 40, putative / transcript_product=Tetratricopeptide repeat protein 40, putative / location=Cvel_scaffold3764:11399-13891(+) / protein_length=352 / sequence_SO=supercontig / SO=protein_coding / is_pseudo=false